MPTVLSVYYTLGVPKWAGSSRGRQIHYYIFTHTYSLTHMALPVRSVKCQGP